MFDVVRSTAVDLLDLEAEQLGEDVSWKDLSVDSLALVEYCMAVEDALGVSLPEDEVGRTATVGAFVDLVASKLS
ncbi:MAG: Phosphopantetheine attachment site [Frankiales bacterium]|nr:Phosphopantetheine attachment site [Frankiales bacterium]